jgi:hypothetical protein
VLGKWNISSSPSGTTEFRDSLFGVLKARRAESVSSVTVSYQGTTSVVPQALKNTPGFSP